MHLRDDVALHVVRIVPVVVQDVAPAVQVMVVHVHLVVMTALRLVKEPVTLVAKVALHAAMTVVLTVETVHPDVIQVALVHARVVLDVVTIVPQTVIRPVKISVARDALAHVLQYVHRVPIAVPDVPVHALVIVTHHAMMVAHQIALVVAVLIVPVDVRMAVSDVRKLAILDV